MGFESQAIGCYVFNLDLLSKDTQFAAIGSLLYN